MPHDVMVTISILFHGWKEPGDALGVTGMVPPQIPINTQTIDIYSVHHKDYNPAPGTMLDTCPCSGLVTEDKSTGTAYRFYFSAVKLRLVKVAAFGPLVLPVKIS